MAVVLAVASMSSVLAKDSSDAEEKSRYYPGGAYNQQHQPDYYGGAGNYGGGVYPGASHNQYGGIYGPTPVIAQQQPPNYYGGSNSFGSHHQHHHHQQPTNPYGSSPYPASSGNYYSPPYLNNNNNYGANTAGYGNSPY